MQRQEAGWVAGDDPKIPGLLEKRLHSAPSFESLATDLRAAGARGHSLLAALNRLMAYALTPPLNYDKDPRNNDPRVDDAFLEGPDLYDDFLRQNLGRGALPHETTLITLNYDCLLERAICRVHGGSSSADAQCSCEEVNYHLLPDVAQGITVLKPHGSINWVGDEQEGTPLAAMPIVGSFSPSGVFRYARIKVVPTPIGEAGDIVVAHYAPGKTAQVNPSTLQSIRDLAIESIDRAARVTIIGVHIPADPAEDPFLHQALTHMTNRSCPVDYVSPDPVDLGRAQDRRFHPVRATFEEFVERHRSSPHR